MKNIILLFGALLSMSVSFVTFAQTPQFSFTDFTEPLAGREFSNDNQPSKIQSIYYPTDFPTMPAGVVKNVYVRIARLPFGPNTAIYPEFTVKMGYTSDSLFSFGNGVGWDTFKVGLTPVFGPATFTTLADSVGRWIKVPLSTPWSFNLERKFVVEFSKGAKHNMTGFDILENNKAGIYRNRTLGGFRDSIRAYNGSDSKIMDLGFDLQTSGVEALGNISSFGLFPNPSHGRFMIALESSRVLGTIALNLRNMAGQTVAKKTLVEQSPSLLRELDFGALPPGIYLLEVNTGEDRLTRRVVID